MIVVRPTALTLTFDFDLMTLTFNHRRAMFMTHTHTHTNPSLKVSSKDTVKTDGRRAPPIALLSRLTRPVNMSHALTRWKILWESTAPRESEIWGFCRQHLATPTFHLAISTPTTSPVYGFFDRYFHIPLPIVTNLVSPFPLWTFP